MGWTTAVVEGEDEGEKRRRRDTEATVGAADVGAEVRSDIMRIRLLSDD